jgi:hypothetical protein
MDMKRQGYLATQKYLNFNFPMHVNLPSAL